MITTEGIRRDTRRVEEEEQHIGLLRNAFKGERVAKKRNGKKERKKRRRLNRGR